MAQRYIYKCQQCQDTILVESTQAGQSITCSRCQSDQKLGTLREIRALPLDQDPSAPIKQGKPTWSTPRRGVFVLGALGLVLGGVTGGLSMWRYSQLDIDRPPWQMSEAVKTQINNLSPAEMLAEWNRNSDTFAVEAWVEPEHLKTRGAARRLWIYGCAGGILAGIGLLLLLVSLIRKWPSRPPAI